MVYQLAPHRNCPEQVIYPQKGQAPPRPPEKRRRFYWAWRPPSGLREGPPSGLHWGPPSVLHEGLEASLFWLPEWELLQGRALPERWSAMMMAEMWRRRRQIKMLAQEQVQPLGVPSYVNLLVFFFLQDFV